MRTEKDPPVTEDQQDDDELLLERMSSESCTLRRRRLSGQEADKVSSDDDILDKTDRPPLLRFLSARALDTAEEFAEGVWSAPSRALNKAEEMAGDAFDRAEELAEEFIAAQSRAFHKAEEMAGDALEKAEELAEELIAVPGRALHKAEEIAKHVWDVVHHHHLPPWLQDNNFLLYGHRPPLHSFRACFKSIFRIHTETGNIWTHLVGFLAFICASWFFLTKPSGELAWQEKAVFSAFFLGAICCLGFSFIFHTLLCHSQKVSKIFSKLDYCGIALLTMGSFVPWLYYSFYCRPVPQLFYNVLIVILGIASIVFAMWDKFAEPKFRPVRAGTFIALGLSGVIPAMHFVITDGWWPAVKYAGLGWLILMAFLYIFGAIIYACRIPERFWPGKFDFWFQSHQIFHVFVVAAAFVHLHGVSGIASHRLDVGSFHNHCEAERIPVATARVN